MFPGKENTFCNALVYVQLRPPGVISMTLIMLLQSVLLGCNISYSSLSISHNRPAQRYLLRDQRTARYGHELRTLSKLTSGGKKIHLKDMLIQINRALLEELSGLTTMLRAVCTLWVMQYGYSSAGFSSPAEPGPVPGSEVHPELLSMATEVQAEILQLPRCWKRFS